VTDQAIWFEVGDGNVGISEFNADHRNSGDPIVPPKGKKLAALKAAAAYIMALPEAKQQSPEWQAVAEALLVAAEDRGPLMHAHVGMMLGPARCKTNSRAQSIESKTLGTAKLKRDE
jgi:hypothetical protein